MARVVHVLNGPNLNLLGQRDPEIYGTTTLHDIEEMCFAEGAALGLVVHCRQSNHEGQLIDWIHLAHSEGAAVIGNFGGYTHTSIAIMDALAILKQPVIEVHLSDIHAREEFRHHSYISLVAADAFIGLGAEGYRLAMRRVAELMP